MHVVKYNELIIGYSMDKKKKPHKKTTQNCIFIDFTLRGENIEVTMLTRLWFKSLRAKYVRLYFSHAC